MKNQKITDKNYCKLYHISDLHCRVTRNQEYREVFQRVIEYLRRQENLEQSLLIITGDLFHSKTKFLPALWRLLSSFLKNLADILEVIVIPGNHDMNEKNNGDLDSLTPICEMLPVHYLKESGLYWFGDLVFVTSSLIDKEFIRFSDIDTAKYPSTTRFIKLYHGALIGSTVDSGQTIQEDVHAIGTTRFRKVKDFEGYDAVLLGDIHKYQFLKPNIAYSGSLIQQNFGESLENHGILEWEIPAPGKPIQTRFTQIKNDYGHVKFFVKDNDCIPISTTSLPKKIYARFYLTRSLSACVESVKDSLIKQGHSFESVSEEVTSEDFMPDVEVSEEDMKHMDDCLILDQLLEELKIDQVQRQKILEYHKEVRTKIASAGEMEMDRQRWKIRHIKFRNMFIYGKDIENTIEFKRGVTVLSAPNNSGKTSILKTIMYGLFDSTEETGSRINMVNNLENKLRPNIEVSFIVGDKSYLLSKEGRVKNIKNGRQIAFSTVLYQRAEEEKIQLTGTTNNETNSRVFEKIGDKDLFSLLNISSTKLGRDFLSMTPIVRLEALHTLYKLSLYQRCQEEVTARIKQIATEVATHTGEISMINTQIQDQSAMQQEITKTVDNLRQLEADKSIIEEQIMELEGRCNGLNASLEDILQGIDSDLVKLNVEQLDGEIGKLQQEISGTSYDACGDMDEKLQSLYGCKSNIPDNFDPDELEILQAKLGEAKRRTDGLGYEDRSEEITKVKGEILSLQDRLRNKSVSALTLEKITAEIDNARKIRGNQAKAMNLEELDSRLQLLYSKRQPIEEGFLPSTLSEYQDKYAKLMGVLRLKEPVVDVHDQLAKVKQDIVILKSELNHFLDKHQSSDSQIVSISSRFGKSYQEWKDRNKDCSYQCVSVTARGLVISALPAPRRKQKSVIRKVATEKMYDSLDSSLSWANEGGIKQKVEEMKYTITIKERKRSKMEKQQEAYLLRQLIDKTRIQYEAYQLNKEIDQEIQEVSLNKATTRKIERLEEEKKLKQTQLTLNNLVAKKKQLEGEQEIYVLKNQIHDHKTNLELYNQNIEIENEIKQIKHQLKCNKKIELLDRKLKQKERLGIQQITIREIQKLKSETAEEDHKLKKARGTRDAIISELSQHEERLKEQKKSFGSNRNRILSRARLEKILDDKNGETAYLQIYKSLVNKSGVPSKLIESKLGNIERVVNEFIGGLVNIDVKLGLVSYGKKQGVDVVVSRDGRGFDGRNLGGYETWVVNMGLKVGLSRYSFHSKSGMMIIDESLDCIDTNNFERIGEVLGKLRENYHSILLISHREVKGYSDSRVMIENDGESSRIERSD